jgi:hypothetical protein
VFGTQSSITLTFCALPDVVAAAAEAAGAVEAATDDDAVVAAAEEAARVGAATDPLAAVVALPAVAPAAADVGTAVATTAGAVVAAADEAAALVGALVVAVGLLLPPQAARMALTVAPLARARKRRRFNRAVSGEMLWVIIPSTPFVP